MMRDLYLLVDPADEVGPSDADHATRLAHDTLGPLVRKLHEDSYLEGQRARLILESRAPVWEGESQGNDALRRRKHCRQKHL